MSVNMRKLEKNVIICKYCEGEGTIKESRCVDYHKGEYITSKNTCYDCKGSGRWRETITREPFEVNNL